MNVKFVFFISLVAYLALVPWVTQNWKVLGDEPHYLLAAHSLVFDHDLDLANNYAQRDYLRFFSGDYLDPHVKILPDGKQILNHDLGLAFILAPAYALGGRSGVEIFLALLGALLAAQIFLLARDITHSSRIAVLTWLALAFTPPLILYVFLIYPEMIGALILIWATRAILFQDLTGFLPREAAQQPVRSWRASLKIWVLGFGISLLPWLSARFFVVLALLILVAGWRWRSARAWRLFVIPALASCAYIAVNYGILAGTAPAASNSENVGANLVTNLVTLTMSTLLRGLVGWWLDQQRGLLILAPVYLLALIGIPRLIREWRGVGIALLLPLLVLNVLMAFLGGFWVAFEIGPRYFVVALPLLAAPLALACTALADVPRWLPPVRDVATSAGALRSGLSFASRVQPWRRYAFALLAGALIFISALNSIAVIQDSIIPYTSSALALYSRALGINLSPIFPAMGHGAQVSPDNARTQVLSTSESDSPVTIAGYAAAQTWFAARGARGFIAQSLDLTDLTVGNYDLQFRAAAANDSDPGAEVLSFDIFSAEGIQVAHASYNDAALNATQAAGHDAFVQSIFNFDNPNYDRWNFPLSLQVATTGAADVWLGALTFQPDTLKTWMLVGIWGGAVIGLIVVFNLGE